MNRCPSWTNDGKNTNAYCSLGQELDVYMLPWIFLGAPLEVYVAAGSIQANLTALRSQIHVRSYPGFIAGMVEWHSLHFVYFAADTGMGLFHLPGQGWYAFFDFRVPWLVARNLCVEMGGDLASFESSNESDSLKSFLKGHGKSWSIY